MDVTLREFHDPTLPPVVMPACPIDKKLKGQKALVTGASSGIGKAVAIGLGHAGADVVVNYVSGPEAAEEVVEEIRRCGADAVAYRADVSREDEVRSMFQAMVHTFGTIDILVNNAGLQKDAPFDEMTLDQWNTVIGVNLTGQFLCAREAIREFKRRGVVPQVSCAAGKIICMSSVHDVIPWAGHVNYAASKGRRRTDDEEHRPGGRPLAHPRQRDLPWRHPHSHQHAGVEHDGGLHGADEAGALQAHRRDRRHRPRRRVACLR
jgi:NADP-dependent 3-hydroxy acid dehydrogenase YdfG